MLDYCPSALGRSSTKMQVVLWQPPVYPWIKVNTDGLSKGNPGLSACGGVFRSDLGDFLGCFSVSLGTHSAYCAELRAVFYAIDFAHSRGWLQLWVESDSLVVITALRTRRLDPPVGLENLWNICLQQMETMIISFSHIFREGNRVADMLADLGLRYPELRWWNNPPLEIQDLLLHDFEGLPNYRVF